MSDETLRKPRGKRLFLVPIATKYIDWLKNAEATLNEVGRQTAGKLQMLGVGINTRNERDPQSLLAIQGSSLGGRVQLFCTLGWVKPNELIKGARDADAIFGRVVEFTQNIAGGDGVIVGDSWIIEVIAARASNIWPPKEPGGCSLIEIGFDTGDRVISVKRILDPSADRQRRLPLVF